MIEKDGIISVEDKKTLELLKDFFPDKIFDAHVHVGSVSFNPNIFAPGSCFRDVGECITIDKYIGNIKKLFPKDVKIGGNMLIIPDVAMCDNKTLREEAVKYLINELEKHPECIGEVPVLAGDTKDEVEKMLIHPRIRGFKCYHSTANKDITWNCNIGEYLSDAVWEVANERGMCITLHMVKDLALADKENLEYICSMSDKYPNAKLILSHAARSFAAWTVVEPIEKLANRKNVYFDFSAICEPMPFIAIIKACGHKRVLWGSDYPISMMRGKCISIGSTFLWLYKEQLEKCVSKTDFSAYLIGMENLLAVRIACKLLELDKKAVEDIFYNNAMELFGLKN